MEGNNFLVSRKGTVVAVMIFLKDLMWHCFARGICHKEYTPK